MRDMDINKLRAMPGVRVNEAALVDQLADSIQKFGILSPLTIKDKPDPDGRTEVSCGGLRLKAVRKLGMQAVPVETESERDERLARREFAPPTAEMRLSRQDADDRAEADHAADLEF